MHAAIVEALLASPEPAIRWRVRTAVLGEHGLPPPESPLARRLLDRADLGRPYAKWDGAHWVLATLADIGHPPGDQALSPLRERVLETWLAADYDRDSAVAYGGRGVPLLDGRHRAHASQQGNALRALTTLGLADERCDRLAALLLRWQWPDGGWNCDRHPAADTSSFCETLTPMRGLHAYGRTEAARRAAEVFLPRRLAFRRRDGELIRPEFAKLHYPLHWHYDVLGGLKAMAELGLVTDPRCADALDLLESLRLADGWPATGRFDRAPEWGGTSTRRGNPWVTVDALFVLRAAGRLVL
ncbi:hypothetical protein ACQP2F_24960 [Actinoplanes sp. CA-030573]|uniref:hypothetical protein n=1 Tax=Actinoplanes sp. CA-030573 TaxID=3239898 RepID=UPI003D8F8630